MHAQYLMIAWLVWELDYWMELRCRATQHLCFCIEWPSCWEANNHKNTVLFYHQEQKPTGGRICQFEAQCSVQLHL